MSARTYTLAELAPDLQDVTVAAWYVRPGQDVREDDDLVDLVTDKAAVTLPAPASGRVVTLGPGRDATVDPGDILVTIETNAHGGFS
jgi:pyruvate dehydrogenase E2 component (dihydrolipoamide acetyltransferase)